MAEMLLTAPYAIALVIFQMLAGYGAGVLGRSRSAAELNQNAQLTIGLLAISMLIALVQSSAFLIVGSKGQHLDEGLLFLLLIVLPAVIVSWKSIPRMVRLARRSVTDLAVFSRTQRRLAAEVWLVVPLQASALGAMLYAGMVLFPYMAHSSILLPSALLALPAAITILAVRQHVRYKHIHRLAGALLLTRMKRLTLLAAAVSTLPLLFSYNQRGDRPEYASNLLREQAAFKAQDAAPSAVAIPWKELSSEQAGRTQVIWNRIP